MCLPRLGLSLQGESSCATTASPLGCGDREKEEKAWRPTSGGSSPSTRPRAVRDRDTWTVQVGILTSGRLCLSGVWGYGSPVLVGAQWARDWWGHGGVCIFTKPDKNTGQSRQAILCQPNAPISY